MDTRWPCARVLRKLQRQLLHRWLLAEDAQVPSARTQVARSRLRADAWSADAKRIAFADDWGPNFARTTEATIKIVSLATNKRTSVTRPKRNRIDGDPAWSPDGRTIAFARQDHGPQTIYLAHRRRVIHHQSIEGIAWRPESK